jgi:hypothetical protein
LTDDLRSHDKNLPRSEPGAGVGNESA